MREPTEYEAAGIRWWNGMTVEQRATALQMAKANTIAAAWDWFNLELVTETADAIAQAAGYAPPASE